MPTISEQQFFDLLSAKLSGDATPDQLVLLQEQLLLNSRWRFMYDQLMQAPAPLMPDQHHTEQAYAAHVVKMQLQGMFEEGETLNRPDVAAGSTGRRANNRLMPLLVLAASVAAVLVITISVYTGHKPDKPAALNEVTTRNGSTSNIKLPDGTEVWLNAGSRITYGEHFIATTREVALTGEAYFNVAHDSAHPFIIHTGKADIRVLGTSFNVRNYPDDNLMETSLIKGRIEVTLAGHPLQKIILKPLQKLILRKSTASMATDTAAPAYFDDNKTVLTAVRYVRNQEVVAETAWMSDKMVFINQPFEEIARELERHYAVRVIFNNPKVRSYRYTGIFDNESLEKVMQIIRLAKRFDYKIVDKTIYVDE